MNRSSIYYMFANPRYAGQVPDPYEPGVFHKANYKPMITMEEYDQIQRILGKKGRPRFSASRQFALKGLIKCGECGCSVTAETKQKTLANGEVHHYIYYHCTRKKPCTQRGSIREEDLFNQLNELLDKFDLSPKLYEWGMQALKEMAEKEVSERSDVQVMQFESMKAVQAKLDRLLTLVADGVITAEQYKAQSEPIKALLHERQEEQAEMAERIKNWYEFVGNTLDKLTCAEEKFLIGDLADKKEILIAIGKNPVLLDKKLVLNVHEWMHPLESDTKAIKRQLQKVITAPEQIRKDIELTICQSWYPGRESNPRPVG